jgi:elongation factor Ts
MLLPPAPQFLDIQQAVDPAVMERERNVQRETALASGKPADIVEKMLDGRMRKYFEEVCLTGSGFHYGSRQQNFCCYRKSRKGCRLPDQARWLYVRYVLGEGIEKEVVDFAAEVASVANG